MTITRQLTSRLPDTWSPPEIVEDVVVADGVELWRAGLASVGPGAEEVTGAAADPSGSPIDRSIYELVERVCTLEAMRASEGVLAVRDAAGNRRGEASPAAVFPTSSDSMLWRHARSNGVALHDSWQSAVLRATWELVERDRVMRSWYGAIAPERLAFDAQTTVLGAARSFAWEAYRFAGDSGAGSPAVEVIGLFGFPESDALPLVFGYGARPDRAAALAAALTEATQLLAFLWGEPVTDQAPPMTPSAMFHLEYFQVPAHRPLLRRWLASGHADFAARVERRRPWALDDVAFVDLTPAWLQECGFCVVKALCDAALPLVFGLAPHAAHLPDELRVHPVA
jgi:hypothetical protein